MLHELNYLTAGEISDNSYPKNFVPQQGIEPRSLVIRASIIPLDHQDTSQQSQ